MAEEPFVPEPSGFSERLILWNGLDAAGFAAWEFLPGMRFGERAAWWRGGADRGGAHEGLDICWYRTGDGRRLSLGAGARVPAIYAGEVVSVVDDFLGASVFVAHAAPRRPGAAAALGLRPRPPAAGAGARQPCSATGTRSARSPTPSGSKSAVPPHLHLTLALIDREGGPERLDWDALREIDPGAAAGPDDYNEIMIVDRLIAEMLCA